MKDPRFLWRDRVSLSAQSRASELPTDVAWGHSQGPGCVLSWPAAVLRNKVTLNSLNQGEESPQVMCSSHGGSYVLINMLKI